MANPVRMTNEEVIDLLIRRNQIQAVCNALPEPERSTHMDDCCRDLLQYALIHINARLIAWASVRAF